MWIRPKIEYEGDHQKIRVQVYPIFKNSKWEGSDPVSLSDDTKAGYKENKLFYALRFDKEGRNYMILVDKKNVKQIDIILDVSLFLWEFSYTFQISLVPNAL